MANKRVVKGEQLPPGLFGGVRVGLAGVLLLGFVGMRGEPLRLGRRDFVGVAVGGVLLFVGGNYLLGMAERTVPSGVAAVLGATTPLWIAVNVTAWPGGD